MPMTATSSNSRPLVPWAVDMISGASSRRSSASRRRRSVSDACSAARSSTATAQASSVPARAASSGRRLVVRGRGAGGRDGPVADTAEPHQQREPRVGRGGGFREQPIDGGLLEQQAHAAGLERQLEVQRQRRRDDELPVRAREHGPGPARLQRRREESPDRGRAAGRVRGEDQPSRRPRRVPGSPSRTLAVALDQPDGPLHHRPGQR